MPKLFKQGFFISVDSKYFKDLKISATKLYITTVATPNTGLVWVGGVGGEGRGGVEIVTLSTSSLITRSFQGDPTIFHKGIFIKQTPHIKN